MAFPRMAPTTPTKREKPLVFISASRTDNVWREYLRTKLDEYGDQIQWWDDSKIKPGQDWRVAIDAAIQRASVAVVFISNAYLASEEATTELRRLGAEGASKLRLFPILLEECPWQQYALLRDVQIWNDAKPIGGTSNKSARTEMGKVARSILDLLKSSAGPVDVRGQFSAKAQEILWNAHVLAQKTNRGRITTSCLLFAFADTQQGSLGASPTDQFPRTALNEKGLYEQEFDAFLKDGNPSFGTRVRISLLDEAMQFSENASEVVLNAIAIANRVSHRHTGVHARHLFASLISLGYEKSGSLRDRLQRLGVEVQEIRSEFRKVIYLIAPSEKAKAWNDVLGIPQAEEPEPEKNSLKTVSDPSSTFNAPIYKTTYSAFIPDRTSYGPRATDVPLDDSLGVRTYASHLAQLIAAKDTFMPLSIGLFGAWGAGKSHFMDLMYEQLREITKEPGRAFHKHIVQIPFNAWHYLDTNLWANLVSEIFDQLFEHIRDRGEKEQLQKLKNKLAAQSALAAEAKVALVVARKVRAKAENRLRSAMQERARQENAVSTLLDIKNLVIDDDLEKQLRDVANGLGIPKVQSSYKELEARAEEVRSLGGRTRALVLAVFTGSGWWRRALLLIVALAAPLIVSWLAVNGEPWIKELLAGAGKTIAQITTAILALSTWLATQVRAGNAVVSKLENAYDKVTKVRADREAKDDAAKAQALLAQKIQAEEQARNTLHEAEEKLKTIRSELAEMAPGRQLIRFLRERATTEDYRRHLGLVSLVRRDFKQLSDLLTAPKTDDTLPKIDRIVLYIDDLDRCRAARVIEVLEAVHLLLAFPLFAVVVAVDPRWLRQSLLDHYPRLLGGIDDNKASFQTRSLGLPATPQDYLEKIFQVPFNLQAMETDGFKALVKHLFTVDGTDSNESDSNVDPPIIQKHERVADTPLETDDGPRVPSVPRIQVPPPPDEPPPAPPPERKPAPPDPERLVLTQKEVKDIQRFQLLFQTPRAVKRLANTYSLIRVGVKEEDWSDYLGFNNAPAGYRVPLLLLAVSSAFPALARPWLFWLEETPPTNWKLDEHTVTKLVEKHSDTTDRADWVELQKCLNKLDLAGWPPPDHKALVTWVPRVARYSF